MTEYTQLGSVLIIDGTEYRVIHLTLHEGIDAIGQLACELTDGAGGPEPAPLVGQKVELTLSRTASAEEHKFIGYVTEADAALVRSEEVRGTRIVAKPRLFRLGLRQGCRVFQEMAVADIVKQVLSDAGIPEGDQVWSLGESYPPRVYVTQYRETDEAFVRRLLAEEGIGFFVDPGSGTDKVVFFDGPPEPIQGAAEIVYREQADLQSAADAVSSVAHRRELVSGKVYLRDYDFERPKLELNATTEDGSEAEKLLEVYDYPGRFTEQADGDRFAKVLLESIRCRREQVSGRSNTLRLAAGRTFELAGHPYAPLNREYLLVALTIAHAVHKVQTDVPSASIHFEAIPTEQTSYRPKPIPRALSTAGAQVAVITGAAGKEIHPDEHGRVKVLFPWDREGPADDTSSLWIRTCQIPLGGSMLTPRVGWEAYLNFIDGDPDQPFVFGRMYNGEKPPPYALPANKSRVSIQTATTPGGGSTNEIRMEDKGGSEQMFMNASHDASVSAKNNATEVVGNNASRSIGANQSLNVSDSMEAKIGANQSLAVAANQSLNIATFMMDDVGSHAMSIGGNRDIKAGGDHNRTISAASTLTIGGMQVDLVAGSSDENGLATMDDTIGAALIELTASDRTVTVKGARKETAGAAKAVLTAGGRAVQVSGALNHKVSGAILTKIGGGRQDASSGDYLEVAAGAQLIKATNVVFEAKNLLSVVMGGSTITLTPASVSIAGTKITLDGECPQLAALIKDN